jgi:hypothetical protein
LGYSLGRVVCLLGKLETTVENKVMINGPVSGKSRKGGILTRQTPLLPAF